MTAFFEADMQFHIQLVSHIANRELNNLFGTYIYRMRNLALHSLHVPGRMEKTYQEHLEIFENMKQGNMIQTYESIVYHMESPRNISIDED
ncbi:FCD domain-containing protein [Anaerotignum lactatifermentans]|uniref:FCD domain-containing protein n=1 Tax=Anaerotignum lactatifermentans TaxID=160404 RepID=UPI003AB4769E